MTLESNFLEYVKTRKALDTEDIHRFMDEMSNEARRITFKLNASFHAPDEVRALLSELFWKARSHPHCGCSRRFIRISERILKSAMTYLSMPAVSFRITARVTLGDGCQIGQ